jgi:hemolysin III
MDFLNPREPVSTWSHGAWLVLALVGLVLLSNCSRGDRARKLTLLIYGLCLVFCAASSTLYHGLRLPGKRINAFALMDHVSIYMLIAGTYTPIAWTFLARNWRRGVLALVWFWAALGITIRLICEPLPSWISTGYYLAMGWGALFCYFEVSRRVSHRAMLPIVAGGVLYSVGATFNLLHRPVLWPGVIQSHELFHFFVVAASLLHFYFILTVVGPPFAESERFPIRPDRPLVTTPDLETLPQ